MDQSARQLINETREAVSNSNTNQKILSDYSTDPEVWGYSKVVLFIMELPALTMVLVAASVLTGEAKLYGYIAAVVLGGLGILVTATTSEVMDARQYFTTVIEHYAHQQEMIFDSNPDESQIEQPKNDSLVGRFARLPYVRDWPIIGAGDYKPPQELVDHKKPFRGEYAIMRDDGWLIAGISISPIPLRLDTEDAKRRVSTAIADALEGTVDFKAQWFSPERVADFETRKSRWEARRRALQARADQIRSANGGRPTLDSIRVQIQADIAAERAANINMQETVNRIREFYVVVSIDPGEAVIERSSEMGGWGTIPGFGKLIEKKRLREMEGTDKHTRSMLRKLADRTDEIVTELGRVNGLTAQAMSSTAFSEVLADHYRATNVRAYDDFTDCIRGSPSPVGEDAGDPEHETTYNHITNQNIGDSPTRTATATAMPDSAANGGAASATIPSSQVTDEDDTDTDTDTDDEAVPASVLNEDALVGLATDEEELSWRYKTAIGPHNFRKTPQYGVLDDMLYTKTLQVRDWPDVPIYGFLDGLTSLSMPAVETTVTTHFTGESERTADRELAEAASTTERKVKKFMQNQYIPDYFAEKMAEQLGDVKRTQQSISKSDYGLYTSHTYIEVRAPSLELLDEAVGRIRSRMQNVSADAVPLKFHHRLGYRTVAPACKDYIGGQTKMVGDGLARLVPWTARNLIEPGGIEWGINEDTGDPIAPDLQNRETGYNIGLWGTIGSGKTTLLTRLLLRLKLLNPEMPLVIIDPKQEFIGFTELFDGDRVVIGSDTGINAFQIEPISEEKREELGEKAPLQKAKRRGMDFMKAFYNFNDLSIEGKQGIWRDVIDEGFSRRGITEDPETHHYDSPTLADDFIPIFEEIANNTEEFARDAFADSDYAKDQLRKKAVDILQNDVNGLEEGGEFEHLAKATDINIDDIDVLCLDLQNYENEAMAGLMMGPLLTAVLEHAKSVDGPMGVAMDEFHYMLHNLSSLETLKQGYRHSRHSNLSLITATQSVEEFFTENEEEGKQLTKSAKQLTNLMSVTIFLYLKEMNEQWAGEFDMSKAEHDYIKDADTGDPTAQALVRVDKEGSFKLDVNYSDELNPREFAMNQYDPTKHGNDLLAYLDDYTDRDGTDVCEWTWDRPDGPLGEIESGLSHETMQDGTASPVLADSSVVDTVHADGGEVSVERVDADANESADSRESDTRTEAAVETETEDVTEDADKGKDEEVESNIKSAAEVIEATTPDEEQSDGLGARLKKSVTGRKDTDDTDDEELSLTDIGAVTARTAGDLQDAGFESVEQVYAADESALVEVDGVDEEKADTIQAQAAEALGIAEDEPDTESENDSDADADTDVDVEVDSDERTTEQEATTDDRDDKPTATVEFTPEESPSETDVNESKSKGSAGIAGRVKDSFGSMFSHSAAGKSQPDLTDIGGVVDERKAAVLRNAGFETVTAVYTADKDALAEVEGIDETQAGYIQNGAEQALDASDAALPERPVENEADTASEGKDGSEADESADTDDTEVESNGDELAQPTLTDIREVGDDRAKDLRAEGYESVADVAAVGQNTLTEVEGIGGARAETISVSATDLLDEQSVAEPAGGDD